MAAGARAEPALGDGKDSGAARAALKRRVRQLWKRGARMATVAGEIRRVQAARHVDWVKGEPPKPRGLARATYDRGRLLGVAAAPHSTYRRVMRATGSGAPSKTSRPKRCGSYTVLTNPDATRGA